MQRHDKKNNIGIKYWSNLGDFIQNISYYTFLRHVVAC